MIQNFPFVDTFGGFCYWNATPFGCSPDCKCEIPIRRSREGSAAEGEREEKHPWRDRAGLERILRTE